MYAAVVITSTEVLGDREKHFNFNFIINFMNSNSMIGTIIVSHMHGNYN
jgi:hypothetical protein